MRNIRPQGCIFLPRPGVEGQWAGVRPPTLVTCFRGLLRGYLRLQRRMTSKSPWVGQRAKKVIRPSAFGFLGGGGGLLVFFNSPYRSPRNVQKNARGKHTHTHTHTKQINWRVGESVCDFENARGFRRKENAGGHSVVRGSWLVCLFRCPPTHPPTPPSPRWSRVSFLWVG
jgi:hypothetical protein